MLARGTVGSFAAGGVTGMIVEMLHAGLFRSLLNVQCFDVKAVVSYRDDAAHQAMSGINVCESSQRGAVVNRLDAMILGAAIIDLDFNVNVTLRADGAIPGGSGGHSDTAAGAKLAIVTTLLTAKAHPKFVQRVSSITTPAKPLTPWSRRHRGQSGATGASCQAHRSRPERSLDGRTAEKSARYGRLEGEWSRPEHESHCGCLRVSGRDDHRCHSYGTVRRLIIFAASW